MPSWGGSGCATSPTAMSASTAGSRSGSGFGSGCATSLLWTGRSDAVGEGEGAVEIPPTYESVLVGVGGVTCHDWLGACNGRFFLFTKGQCLGKGVYCSRSLWSERVIA